MSSSPCVIPAPPTLPPAFGRPQKSHLLASPIITRKSTAECLWAVKHEDVHKACVLAQVCTASLPREYRIKLGVHSIIQEGPTCGPVALAMLVATGTPTVHDILQVAKERRYTNHGEMFSVVNMHSLVQSVFDTIGGDYINARLYRGQLDSDNIRHALRNGASIMVAYDSDFNHAPCSKNGHKAHWTVITGYLIDDFGKFHVFCRHGKTKNLAVWTLQALSASNSNLIEYVTPKRYGEFNFQLPLGGIAGENGLRNQCIIIDGLQNLDEIQYPALET